MEGIGGCLSSGACEAYIYSTYGETAFVKKSAHSANYGTIGFIISTITYVFIYQYFDMDGLLISTIVSGILAVLFAIGLEKSPCETGGKNHSHDISKIMELFKNHNSRSIMLILSIFSVIWILINFFYVEKLTSLGISEEWISGIILGYSLIEMLAEPIVSWRKRSKNKTFYSLLRIVRSGSRYAWNPAKQGCQHYCDVYYPSPGVCGRISDCGEGK